jgi:amidohydrolase
MPIRNRIAEMQPEIAAWRQDIHAHPEILYDTHRTAALVADKLRLFGLDEITTGIGRTGVVGVIRGKTDTSGRVIGLRADMDALPIHEQTGATYASTVPGAMHACGHDGHTAMLLGAAQYLAETRNFDGTVVVIFQPAEEGGNGAKAMMDDGLLDRWEIDEVYALHNRPGLAVGQFATCAGPILAAVDEFEIVIDGKGGHAAKPNNAVDPTVAACQLIVALQTIISRNSDPVLPGVLTVGSVETSSKAYNVIPQSVTLKGTVRTHHRDTQDMAEARIAEIAEGIAAAAGATAHVRYARVGPATVNAGEPAAFAADVARAVSGSCDTSKPVMGGEDFAFMLEDRPGAFILVGNGDSAGLHHPEYDFNDDAIPAGSSFFAELVERRMPAA